MHSTTVMKKIAIYAAASPPPLSYPSSKDIYFAVLSFLFQDTKMLGYLEADPISFSLDVVILVVVLCNCVTES